MSKDILTKKEARVLQNVCTAQVQAVISQPQNSGICFTFPIKDLIKNSDCSAQFYTYSTRDSGFQEWQTNGALKTFQESVVGKMGQTLKRMVKPSKQTGPSTASGGWRQLGGRYVMVYLPLHFKDVIWCKCDSLFFHVILPQNHGSLSQRRGSNDKEWLLALLELGSDLELQCMRLYIRRDDLSGVSTFLRNLNWIGGKLVPNENREGVLTGQDPNFDDLILGDENYVILEFEC